jgi:hypothetical protein
MAYRPLAMYFVALRTDALAVAAGERRRAPAAGLDAAVRG